MGHNPCADIVGAIGARNTATAPWTPVIELTRRQRWFWLGHIFVTRRSWQLFSFGNFGSFDTCDGTVVIVAIALFWLIIFWLIIEVTACLVLFGLESARLICVDFAGTFLIFTVYGFA